MGMVLYTVYADCDPITAGQIKKKDQVIRMRLMEMMMMMMMISMEMMVIRVRSMDQWNNGSLQGRSRRKTR